MRSSIIAKVVIAAGLILILAHQAHAWRCCRNYPYNGWYRYDSCQNHAFGMYSDCHAPGYAGFCRPYRAEIYSEQDGWDLIIKNRPGEALAIFEDIAEASPAVGDSELGIAIAAADAGQWSQSVSSMRRLLEFAPGALQLFEPDRPRIDILDRLVKEISGQSHYLSRQDACFMQACFSYLLRDKKSCLAAVRQCKETGDRSDSALNLYFMAENDSFRWSAVSQ